MPVKNCFRLQCSSYVVIACTARGLTAILIQGCAAKDTLAEVGDRRWVHWADGLVGIAAAAPAAGEHKAADHENQHGI